MVMTLVRVTLVLGGTAAYVGLAILGWGGWPAFFSHPARGALAVALAVLAGISLCADGNLRPGLREDRGNCWVIGALALLGLLAASLPAYTDRKAFRGFLPNPPHAVRRMKGDMQKMPTSSTSCLSAPRTP